MDGSSCPGCVLPRLLFGLFVDFESLLAAQETARVEHGRRVLVQRPVRSATEGNALDPR